jgi:hypothetical protein
MNLAKFYGQHDDKPLNNHMRAVIVEATEFSAVHDELWSKGWYDIRCLEITPIELAAQAALGEA